MTKLQFVLAGFAAGLIVQTAVADTVSVGVPSSAKNASTLASGIFLCRDVRPLSSEWVTWTYRVGSGGA